MTDCMKPSCAWPNRRVWCRVAVDGLAFWAGSGRASLHMGERMGVWRESA